MVKARTLWPGVESPPAPTGQGAEHPVYPCQSNCISSPDCHLLNDPSNNGKGILSFDDGIVAYSLGLPVMSGLGFTLDHPAVLAKQAHKLLEVAYERGFRCLTSVNYMPPLPATVGEDVTEDIRKVFWLSGENIDKWTFKLAYVQPETGHRFVQFEPRTNYTPTESILQNDPCDGRAF